MSKQGTLSRIEPLYEIASEAQHDWCAQGRPISKWVRISFMLLHGVQFCQTSKQRNCLWDWTLQLESLAANQSQAWKAEEQTVQIFLALACLTNRNILKIVFCHKLSLQKVIIASWSISLLLIPCLECSSGYSTGATMNPRIPGIWNMTREYRRALFGSNPNFPKLPFRPSHAFRV